MIDFKSLVDAGLTDQQSSLVLNILDGRPSEKSSLSSWQKLTQLPFVKSLSFDLWLEIWSDHLSRVSAVDPPAPMWIPHDSDCPQTQLAKFINEVDSSGGLDWTESVSGFHSWSRAHRGEFWKRCIGKLGIEFHEQPGSIISGEEDVEHVRWLEGASLNIAESCFLADSDAVAIQWGTTDGRLLSLSYGQLRRQANQVSNSLRDQGIQAGDRVGLIMPMTPESISLYLGIIQAGCVAVSIADSFAAPEIQSRLEISEANLVFTYDAMVRIGKELPLYERVLQANPPQVVVLAHADGSANELRDGDLSWQTFLANNDHFDPVISAPDSHINILFSSGTTGQPKAIPWTQTTPIKCAVDGMLHHDIQPGNVVAWPTNLGWMMGPWLIFATLINRGTIAIYDDAPLGAGFGRFIQDAQVNMLGVVPTMVKNWRKTGDMQPFDWSSIRAFSSTGEASLAEDMFYLSYLAGFKPVIEYCGGTEIGGGYVSSTLLQPNAPATFSTACFGLGFHILDESGSPADEGEVFLEPPSIGLSQQLLNRDHHETYYADVPTGPHGETLRRHGDFFVRLPGGYFTAGGRSDDTMNLGGIKTSSVEIERILNRLDLIRETAAVAVPLEKTGPAELCVVCVLQEPGNEVETTQLLKDMNTAIRQNLNPLFKIARLRIEETLPRTASNKILRREIRKKIALVV